MKMYYHVISIKIPTIHLFRCLVIKRYIYSFTVAIFNELLTSFEDFVRVLVPGDTSIVT